MSALLSLDVRNWLSAILGVVIMCGVFGSDLLYFHQAGVTADVGLIVGAVGALGVHAGYQAGKGVN